MRGKCLHSHAWWWANWTRLQAVLKLASVLGPCYERTHIQGPDCLVLQGARSAHCLDLHLHRTGMPSAGASVLASVKPRHPWRVGAMAISLLCIMFTHLQGVRHIVVHNALCEALHHGGLPHAWLPNQARVVLRAPRQDLDCSPARPNEKSCLSVQYFTFCCLQAGLACPRMRDEYELLT